MAEAAARQHPFPSPLLCASLKVIATELVEPDISNLVCNKALDLLHE